MTLGTILLIVLVLLLVGALPTCSHSRSWGYAPSGVMGVLVVLLIPHGTSHSVAWRDDSARVAPVLTSDLTKRLFRTRAQFAEFGVMKDISLEYLETGAARAALPRAGRTHSTYLV